MKKVNIIFGDSFTAIPELIREYLSDVYSGKCEINLLHGRSITEVVSLLEEQEFDIFMVVLNNLSYDGSDIQNLIELVSYVKENYQKPIFAFYGVTSEVWKDRLSVELLCQLPVSLELLSQKFNKYALTEN